VPDLVHPPGQPYLEEPPDTYDRSIAFMMQLFGADEARVRRSLVDLLDVGQGASVLEVACGPGPNLPHLLEALGPDGRVCALDISPDMLRAASRRTDTDARLSFVLANGGYLPFADAIFDAVLHVGTLNRFDDIRRALAEMARVVRPGGRVVAADEGVAPWLEATAYGQVLARFGTLFQGTPPLQALPACARDVTLRWLPGQAFFAIDFKVGAGPPALNLDVQLPGRAVTVRAVLDASPDRAPRD
jgi:SAM-dependent methyltransferase